MNELIRRVAIVDTGVANAASVLYAFERILISCQLTRDPEVISSSSHVVLPGVGTAQASMKVLAAQSLDSCIRGLTQPVLGICLGMQLFFEESEEGQRGYNTRCLGVLQGTVRRISSSLALPIPHMGWNQVKSVGESKLLQGIPEESYFYFVHSYAVPQGPEVRGFADYGVLVPAIVESRNWYGTQFHPERSGEVGQQVLKNFIRI